MLVSTCTLRPVHKSHLLQLYFLAGGCSIGHNVIHWVNHQPLFKISVWPPLITFPGLCHLASTLTFKRTLIYVSNCTKNWKCLFIGLFQFFCTVWDYAHFGFFWRCGNLKFEFYWRLRQWFWHCNSKTINKIGSVTREGLCNTCDVSS